MKTIPTESLRDFDLVYLGTPYTKFPGGIETAFRAAASLTANLLRIGVKVYSPIAHTHPIAIHGGLDPLDHQIWLPFDAAIMAKSAAILVAKMPTWEQSYGIRHEIEEFNRMGKPVMYLDPVTFEVTIQE